MKRAKSFLAGMLTMLVLASMLGTAIASNGSKMAELFYRNIKITVNGTAVDPKDANGNTVEPFIIDGTTYLPVRAVGSAMGLDVDWDADTSTVMLENKNQNATLEGTILLDESDVKLIYKGYEEEYGLLEYNFYFENNTDKTVMFAANDVSVNDFMDGFSMAEEVQPGKKSNSYGYLSLSFLERNAIASVEKIEFTLVVYDSDDWNADNIVEKQIILIP